MCATCLFEAGLLRGLKGLEGGPQSRLHRTHRLYQLPQMARLERTGVVAAQLAAAQGDMPLQHLKQTEDGVSG